MKTFIDIIKALWALLKKAFASTPATMRKYKENVKFFFKHPIRFSRQYIQEFREASTGKKVAKVLWTLAGIAGVIFATYLVIAIICMIFMFFIVCSVFAGGSDGYYSQPEPEYIHVHHYH